MSATAMAAAIPLAVYGMLRADTRWRRVFSGAAVVLLGAALLASTGRVAALGLASGGGVMLVALLVRKRWTRTAFAIVAVTALVGAVQYIGPAGVLNLADQLVYARGDGSVTSRTEVYRATLSGIAERPVLGWGTERDVEGLLYPAGSHSYYLGVAYKHGLVGLCVLSALCWRLWRDSTPTGAEHPKTRTLLMCARWTFMAVAVNAITDAPDLDAITLQAFWTVAGIAVGSAGLVRAHEASSPARRVYRPLAGDPA
jgi:O-antigen ligase